MHVTAAEPFPPDILSDRLESLAVELPLAAGRFVGRLAPQVRASIGDLVRSMKQARVARAGDQASTGIARFDYFNSDSTFCGTAFACATIAVPAC